MLYSLSTSGLKWISGGSGVAEGPFLLLSADGTGCLGWLVSYLPWPTNIHRGPTPFGTLKSFFLHRMGNQPGWITGGLRHGCHMASFYPQWSLGPLGCPASKCTQEILTICGVTKAFWQFMLLFVVIGTSLRFICIFQD